MSQGRSCSSCDYLLVFDVELGYMSHTARRFFTGKNSYTDGNWMDSVVTEGPGLRSGAHLRRHQLPKGEMFRTIGDTEATTVLGLMVVVLSLSISSSLTV